MPVNAGLQADERVFLVVEGGPDHGLRLLLDEKPRIVGRGRDVDLVLHDPSTSRRHAEVRVERGVVHVAVMSGVAPFLLDGRTMERATLPRGARILLGQTWLRVETAPDPDGAGGARSLSTDSSDVKTLLTGTALDVRALAALFALVEILDAAKEAAALGVGIETWALQHDIASSVTVDPDDPDSKPGDRSTRTGAAVLERRGSPDVAILSVPTMCERPARLSFAVPARSVSDSRRCLLVVAARVFGSASERVRRMEASTKEREALRELRFGSARGFLGSSAAALNLSRLVPRLAASDVNVLIEGETGVGKTFFARLIHETSARASEPLRVINCASIPESLLESELFGHERGAFTGATSARAGALESAGNGTLFLDEIGELSMASQAKLLRALEEKKFERLGSNRTLELLARVLCATNRDLGSLAKEGRFRSDLLFRISVVKLTIPPLRERGEDLVLLAKQLLADAVAGAHRRIDGFAQQTLDVIRTYSWPGNVRELRNAIDHAIVLGDEPLLQPTDLPAGILARPGDPPDRGSASLLGDAVDAAERGAIAEALRATGGNRTRAAALLGISRNTLYEKLRRL
ncbi:MAG: sigma 54-interacting transcriptional regulator [Polyangiaceae bacterium]